MMTEKKSKRGRPENEYDNNQLRAILQTTDSRKVTKEARDLIIATIAEAMPSSKYKYAWQPIFYILSHADTITLRTVKYYLDDYRTNPNVSEKLLHAESVKVYKKVCIAVSEALIANYAEGLEVVRTKEPEGQQMTDEQWKHLAGMKYNKRSIDEMIQYLLSINEQPFEESIAAMSRFTDA